MVDTRELFGRSRNQSETLCTTAALGHLHRTGGVVAEDGDRVDAVARVLCDQELVVDPRDRSVALPLLRAGFWEWWISKVLAETVRPGDVCVDVGANAGYFTALFVGLGAGCVHAIEPLPELARRLRATAARNEGWEVVTLHELAVADRTGELTIRYAGPDNLGGASMFGSTGPTVTAPVVTLDELLAGAPRVDVVKLDAEGAEPLIWAGMEETLARHPELVVLAELLPNPRSLQWVEDLARAGYPTRMIDHDGDIVPTTAAALADVPVSVLYLQREGGTP